LHLSLDKKFDTKEKRRPTYIKYHCQKP